MTTYAPLSTVLTNQAFGSISSNSVLTVSNNPQPTLKVVGDLEVNGRDILKELDEIREMLSLLQRDIDMENKYPKLKEIKDKYEQALEKYKTFDIIKKST